MYGWIFFQDSSICLIFTSLFNRLVLKKYAERLTMRLGRLHAQRSYKFSLLNNHMDISQHNFILLMELALLFSLKLFIYT